MVRGSDGALRLALFGTPGAGKSTTCQIIDEYCASREIPYTRIKLADPLYKVQAEVYRLAGRQLNHYYQQDSELLGFLGLHFRKINESALVEAFGRTVDEIEMRYEQSRTEEYVLVCDDMRALDWPYLRDRRFAAVRVVAPDQMCLERRRERGDLSVSEAVHPIDEALDSISSNYEIENNREIADLRAAVVSFLAAWIPGQ